MEHILDRSPRRWGTDEFVFAAEQLGRTTGAWLSSGAKLDYLKANLAFAEKHPEIGAEFRAYLKSMGCKVD